MTEEELSHAEELMTSYVTLLGSKHNNGVISREKLVRLYMKLDQWFAVADLRWEQLATEQED